MVHKQDQNRLDGASPNVAAQSHRSSHSGCGFYEIHVKGQLNSNWSNWLEGLEVKLLENGEMILFGPIVDQAALMGVLNKLSRLNLALISLNEVKTKDERRKS
jgi:hypothetical protein